MGLRDDMFRGKVLLFMVPLLLPIGQPASGVSEVPVAIVDCEPPASPDAATSVAPLDKPFDLQR